MTDATETSRVDGPLARRYRWLTVGMFAVIFLAAFEAMAVTTIMPLVARSLHGESVYALAFAVPLAAGIIGMVIAGNWVDRHGPLPALITAAVLFAVGVAIAGTAGDMFTFIVGRFVHGLAGAAVIVPLYVIVARVYPVAVQARVFASFAAAWVIPSIIGPALAGYIAQSLSWHWVFLGVILLLVPAATAMLVPVLRIRDQVGGDTSVPWSISRPAWAVVTAAAILGLSLSRDAPSGWNWVIAAATFVLAAFAIRPLLPAGTLLLSRVLPATVMLKLIVAGAFFGTEIYLPYLFITHYGFSPALAGTVLTGAGVSWAVASWLQGRLIGRLSDSRAIAIGATCLAVALAAVLLVAWFGLTPWIAFVAWTLAGGAMGLMYPRFTVSVLQLSPQSAQGFNSAALTVAESVGASTALALTALVSVGAGAAAFSADFALTLAIAVAAVLLVRRVRPPHAS